MRHPLLRRAAGLAAAAVLTLTACGGQSLPGTAAQVGGATITVDTLQEQVGEVLAYRDAEPPADGSSARDAVPLITQQVLGQQVRHVLLAEAAERTGLVVDEQAVAAQLAGADDGLLANPALLAVTPDTLEEFLRDQLLTVQLGQQAWDSLAVTIDVVPAADRTEAVELAGQMAVGDDESAALVAQLGGQGGLELTPGTVGPDVFATPVFSGEQGSGLAFQLGEQWQAARVVQRSTDAEPVAGAQVVTAADADLASASALGLSLLTELSGDVEVRLNPRYGQWDAGRAVVIADSDVPAVVVVDAPLE